MVSYLHMYFDALTLATIAQELRATIVGGRVQRVLLPDTLSIGLEVYAQQQRYQLLASAHPSLARVHLVQGKLSRGVEQETPLLLLLRKYMLGGRISAIEQPYMERILIVSIVKESKTRNHTPDAESYQGRTGVRQEGKYMVEEQTLRQNTTPVAHQSWTCELVIETMDRRSNIILVDSDNLILDSIKRISAQKSRRVILPRYAYELPPKQATHDPAHATADDLTASYVANNCNLVRALVRGYRGISPLVAREVVHRTHVSLHGSPPSEETTPSDLDYTTASAVTACLRELLRMDSQPTLVKQAEKPVAYAPYQLTHIEGEYIKPASMSVALDEYYREHQQVTSHHQHREHIQHQLAETRKRLQHQLDQLNQALAQVQKLDRLRWEGEMIYAFLHTITPGQEVLEVEGEQIALDPSCSAAECAQQRFHAYQKSRSGLERLPERLQETENQLAGLEEISTLLELAEEREQIEQIADDAQKQGYLPVSSQRSGKKRRSPRLKPLHLVSSEGIDIYAGRSASQNMEVTFRIAQPDDIWLHVRGMPGAHVIIRSSGQKIPEATLHEAAGLAAYFSRARHEQVVDVDIAPRSAVRRVSGGPAGLVTYQARQTLLVAPRAPW